ncbi:MAG: glycosyltransferase family 2 protein [bacterium]|nr:glycosyltransferase family 2 protein [bacterium]
MKPSVTIIIPAYNEAGNLAAATHAVLAELKTGEYSAYEIIIVDDNSTDGTANIADNLVMKDSCIRVVHNQENKGIGFNFMLGWNISKGEYTGIIPGDNELTQEAVHNLLSAVGKADIIVSYIANPHVRPLLRQIISKSFTGSMNMLFNTRLRYLTGPGIIRTKILRELGQTNPGFAFMMEILVQLVRAGFSYTHAAMPIQPRSYGKAKVFRLKDIRRVAGAVGRVIKQVYFTGNVARLRVYRLAQRA